MNKVIVFFWEPGSCGDFVHSLLLSHPTKYQGVIKNFRLNDHGRIAPEILDFFIKNFDSTPGEWYHRIWSKDDCKLLSDHITRSDYATFIIPTHQLDQVEFLKSQFVNSVSVGITYNSTMFPLVIKNFCKKAGAHNAKIQNVYNQPIHQYLRDKNKFGEFLLTEQLKRGTNIKTCVDQKFDINISLEDLYSGNLTELTSLLLDSDTVIDQYHNWITKQNIIHRYQFDISKILHCALGYNPNAPYTNNLNVELDTFDNILIKHHCNTKNLLNQIPIFKTLQEASNFFDIHESLIITNG